MGCDYYVTCRDCKVTYYCGYGSYSTWVVADSVEKFIEELHRPDTRTPHYKAVLWKNRNVLTALVLHPGHNVEYWSTDWCYHNRGGDLLLEGAWGGAGDIIVQKEKSFNQVDLEKDDR